MLRMLALSAVCLLALTVSAFADDASSATEADKPDSFGKTDAEILDLGQSGWYDYYTAPDRGGESTAGMAQAYEIYADAAQRRNDALPQKGRAAELRKLLDDFSEQAINLASNFTGGGTMWIPLYAQADCDAEDIVYGVLGGTVLPVEATTTGQVARALDKLQRAIEEEHKDKDAAMFFKYGEAKASQSALRKGFAKIKALAAGLDRADSDRVLQFCLTWVTVGITEEEDVQSVSGAQSNLVSARHTWIAKAGVPD